MSRDRILSVHDPGDAPRPKSSSRRFDGHKAAVVVDTDSQLITAVGVNCNAADDLGALELVEASEASAIPVEEAMGDAAYKFLAILARPSPTLDAGWWP